MIFKIIFYILKLYESITKYTKEYLKIFFRVNRRVLGFIIRIFDTLTYWTLFKSIVRTKELWILFFIRVLCSANMYRTFSLDEIKRYNEAYSYVNGARFYVLKIEFKDDLTKEQKKLIIDDFNLKFANLSVFKMFSIYQINKFKTLKITAMFNLIDKSNLYKPIKNFILKKKLILWYLAVIDIKIKIIKEKFLRKKEELKEKKLKKIEEFKEMLNNIYNINNMEKNIIKKIFLIIKEIFKNKKIKKEENIKIKTKTETEKIWLNYKNHKYLIKEFSYKIAAWEEYSKDDRFKFWDLIYF